VSVKHVIDTIAEALKLAQRVEGVAEKIADLSRLQREDAKELRTMLHELDKRIVKIETLIEYSQRPAPAGNNANRLELVGDHADS